MNATATPPSTTTFIPNRWFVGEPIKGKRIADLLISVGFDLNADGQGLTPGISDGTIQVCLPDGWNYAVGHYHGLTDSRGELIAQNVYKDSDPVAGSGPQPIGLVFAPRLIKA